METLQPDPNFPNRPTHPSFAIISSALIEADAVSDKGEGITEDVVTLGLPDLSSMVYAGTQRTNMGIDYLIRVNASDPTKLTNNLESAMIAAWLDGFMAGYITRRKEQEDK